MYMRNQDLFFWNTRLVYLLRSQTLTEFPAAAYRTMPLGLRAIWLIWFSPAGMVTVRLEFDAQTSPTLTWPEELKTRRDTGETRSVSTDGAPPLISDVELFSREDSDALGRVADVPDFDVGGGDGEDQTGAVADRHHVVGVTGQGHYLLTRHQVPHLTGPVCKETRSPSAQPHDHLKNTNGTIYNNIIIKELLRRYNSINKMK